MDENTLENMIEEKELTAPRVTPEDVDSEIQSEQYHVFEGSQLTVCCLTLRNGYTVTGESACASPANFDTEIGRAVSRNNARNKIWGLLGFRLKDKLLAES